MTKQEQIPFSRVNRTTITEVVQNNNASDILRDYLFTDDTRSISLSATEAHDVAAITGQSLISISLSITEAIDTITAALSAVISTSLSAIDAQDTAAVTAENIVSISIASGEVQDTAHITIVDATPRNIIIASTENIDTSTIKAIGQRKRSGDFYRGGASIILKKEDRIYQAPRHQNIYSALNSSETIDTANFCAVVVPMSNSKMAIKDNSDSMTINVDGEHDRRYTDDEIYLLSMIA
jgi:hypothetical protein